MGASTGRDEDMKWEWKGKEDDPSGVLVFEFKDDKASIELPSFVDAHRLAQLVINEIQSAERRGSMCVVARYSKLGEEIRAHDMPTASPEARGDTLMVRGMPWPRED